MALLRNLHHGLRILRGSPGLAVTVLLTLALGIGANTAIFSVVYATLLAPWPYPHPDQLVMVWSKPQGQRRDLVSAGDFAAWKRQSAAFQDLNAWMSDNFNIAAPDRPEFVDGMEATPGYPAMLGIPLMLGRDFLPEEGEPGKQHVVILTHRLWLRLGANPNIVGQNLRINAEPYTVVGVMAQGAADRHDEELIVPLAFQPKQLADHENRGWAVTGRLKPGVAIAQAQAEMDSLAARLANEHPKSNQGLGSLVEPFQNDLFSSDRQLTLWLLLGAVGFLLLIACVNVANLLLAKGATRHREVAIRGALGARPAAIFQQFLTESLALAILGGVLGVAAGYAMLHGLLAALPQHSLPAEADPRLNLPILLIALAATTLAGVLFGCAPAWAAARVSPAEILKEGGRAGMGTGRRRLRRILVIAEFAIALPLLAGAGLEVHSLCNLTQVDLGVSTDHILGFYLDSPSIQPDRDHVDSYYRNLLAGIAAVPGVTRVSAMTHLPLDSLHYAAPFRIAGLAGPANPSARPTADMQTATPDYFQTFGIRIVKGRAFASTDTATSVPVAMVNEAFADSFLKGLDPLAQRVILYDGPGPGVERQIVGVFHNVKSRGVREDFPQIATPFFQTGPDVAGIGIRTAEDPARMIPSIAAALHAVDSQAAMALTRTMRQVHDEALANDRFAALLFSCFAILALLLAAVGIYGVMAFSTAQRSREFALRMALGATRQRVLALAIGEGLALACAGLAVGLIGAFLVGRAMRNVLFGVGEIDFSVLGSVGLALFLAALLACYLPAFKAASVETMDALKTE